MRNTNSPKKSWALKRGKGSEKKTFRIFLFECPKCGRSFRKAKPEEDSIYCEREMEQLRKPFVDKEGKLSRILVEWICGKCQKVHRISFTYLFRPVWHGKKGIRAKWRYKHVTKVDLDHDTTLSEMNEFLNSLFSEKFNTKEYVKIYYLKKLLVFLTENEEKNNLLPSKPIHSYLNF